MKKNYLLALAAIAIPAMAQTASDFEGLMGESPVKNVPARSKGSNPNPATEADVIFTPPCVTDGHSTDYIYEVGCSGLDRVGLNEVKFNTENGMKGIITADTMGDKYYIKEPLIRTTLGSYIVGTLVEDEDTEEIYIECQLPQWLNARESSNTGVTISLGSYYPGVDGFTYYDPVSDPNINKIRYVMDDDENFVLQLPEGYDLCAFYTYLDELPEEGVFAGKAIKSAKYVNLDPRTKIVQTLPDNVEPEQWGMVYSNGDQAHYVTCALTDEKVYFKGIFPKMPEAVISGTIKDNKVTFEAGQYLGETVNSYEYLVMTEAKFISTDDRGDVFDFSPNLEDSVEATLDPTTKNISFPLDMAVFANAGTTQLYYSGFYVGPVFSKNPGGPATPVNPEFVEVLDFDAAMGYGGFDVKIPLLSTDNRVLDKDKYSYIVYFDGEPYTFDAEIYEGLEQDMTIIPWTYEDPKQDYFESFGNERIVRWVQDGFSKVGVQSIYTVDGVENRSQLVEYQLRDVSVDSIGSDAASVEYFDLTGMRVANPSNGLYIKRAVLSDGSVKTTKVIVKK
ncbi:MAG: hypothetical protein NC217_08080 [Muribaculaceae bacterium]|nr:hypothetical protein [Muribaculaceae bacterium]